jgi:hypothetical protein
MRNQKEFGVMKFLFLLFLVSFLGLSQIKAEEPTSYAQENTNTGGANFEPDFQNPIPTGCACNTKHSGNLNDITVATKDSTTGVTPPPAGVGR